MTAPALHVSHLTVAYKESPVLLDINVTIPQQVLVGIVGPNGAGKTTFIKSLLGLVKPLAGTISLLGKTKYDIGYVPQRSTIDWDFPIQVLDVVLMGSYHRLGWFKRPGKKEIDEAMDILNHVGLINYAQKNIGALSGGQQQRTFLARALMQNASLYFMDEPFAGVDMATEQTIISILKDLTRQGKTVMVVHHDLTKLRDYFDWLLMLNVKKIACGPINDVLNDHNIIATYGKSLL